MTIMAVLRCLALIALITPVIITPCSHHGKANAAHAVLQPSLFAKLKT